MTFFAGHHGAVRLRRNTTASSFTSTIIADDVNTGLNRVGFNGSMENLLTGDRVVIEALDGATLDFLPSSAWDVNSVQSGLALYVNVNLAGGVRFFKSFLDAVNNTRANEIQLVAYGGAPIPISVRVEDSDFNTLASVTGFTLQTERESIDTTVLSDKFKQFYSAGLLSGSGSIDCLFSYWENETEPVEMPLLMLQIIQRVEIGSVFNAQLILSSDESYGSLDVYYDFEALITRAGVEVRSDALISCAIDFVATGEIKLRVGKAQGYVLKEDQNRILLTELGIDALLKEVED